MSFNNEVNVALLSVTTIDLSSSSYTYIYIVPTGKRCILSHAVLVIGPNGGDSGTQFKIGSPAGSNADWVSSYAFSGLSSQYDAGYISPVPSSTPPVIKSYGAGTQIAFEVTSNSGASGNTLFLFGTLYTA